MKEECYFWGTFSSGYAYSNSLNFLDAGKHSSTVWNLYKQVILACCQATLGHTLVAGMLQETLPLLSTDFSMFPLPGLPVACHGQLGGGGSGHPGVDSLWAPLTPPWDLRNRDWGRPWQPLTLCTSQAWSSRPELQGVPIEFPQFLLPEDRGNIDVFGCLMTKDNKDNETTCFEGGVNLPLPEKKGLRWQPQQMKVGTSYEGRLYYLLYAQGAAAATSYTCLPIKINPDRYLYLASHVHMGCFSKLHHLPPAALPLPCQSNHGAAWGHCGTE